MTTLTAHCLVKNEENFIEYSVKSVINFVDKIIIFDTGSVDATVKIIERLKALYPDKVVFEEKGECSKERHTQLRQEMIEKTTSRWFMILDGDEVWTERAMNEALMTINKGPDNIECLIAPFYLCVGDVFHYSLRGNFEIMGRLGHFTPRFYKNNRGINWRGNYGLDSVFNEVGKPFFNQNNSLFLVNKFWHLTHLKRSNFNEDYSSGGKRENKVIESYLFIGKKNVESLPEVFIEGQEKMRMSFSASLINFWPLILRKVKNKMNI